MNIPDYIVAVYRAYCVFVSCHHVSCSQSWGMSIHMCIAILGGHSAAKAA